MTTQDKPLVSDIHGQWKAKTVWAKHGKFYSRCGTGTIQVEPVQPGMYRALPGTLVHRQASEDARERKAREYEARMARPVR
jgi:hypothetical protein